MYSHIQAHLSFSLSETPYLMFTAQTVSLSLYVSVTTEKKRKNAWNASWNSSKNPSSPPTHIPTHTHTHTHTHTFPHTRTPQTLSLFSFPLCLCAKLVPSSYGLLLPEIHRAPLLQIGPTPAAHPLIKLNISRPSCWKETRIADAELVSVLLVSTRASQPLTPKAVCADLLSPRCN